jgi:hypothetical protein
MAYAMYIGKEVKNEEEGKTMTLKEAYETGWNTGYDIARSNWNDRSDTATIEEFISECQETESDHFRQYSPFEFTAQEFNESRNPDKTWERYGSGVSAGINAFIKGKE